MREDPDIIKILREEERIGLLTGQSQDTYEELATSEEVLEDMSNKNISVMKDAVDADSLFSEDKKEWSNILDSISDWICVLDKNHRIIRTNLAVKKITGLSPSEIIGQTCCKITHGLDKPIPGCPLEKMLLSRKRESLEIQIPDSDRWLKVTVDSVTDDKGNIIGAVHIISDITEQKKTEEILKESEKRYEDLLESSADSIYVLDEEWRHVLVNNAAVKFVNMPKEKLLGNKLTDLFPGIEKTAFFKTFEKVMKTRKSNSVIDKYIFEDGRSGFYEVNVTPVSEGILCISRDITYRKESEEKIRNILESSPDSITVSDLQGNITECNEATLKVHGFSSKEEVIGKSAFMYFPKREQKRAMENLQKTLKEGSMKNLEYTLLKKDGEEFPAELSVSVINDASGKPVSFVAITKDITERKKVEEELKENEEKFKSLYFSMNEGVCLHEIIYDKSGKAIDYKILDINPSYEKITGLKKEDAIGCIASKLYKTGNPPYLDIYSDVANTGNSTTFETYFPPMEKHFSISVFSPEKGKFATIFSDITESKNAEDKLKNSEEKYRNITELSPDGIMIVNKKGVVTSCNPAFFKLIGFSKEEIVGKNALTIPTLTLKSKLKMAGTLKTILKGDIPEAFDFEWKHKDGSSRIGNAKIGLLKKNDKLQGFQTILRDVTKDRAMQIKIKEHEERYRSLFDKSMDLIYINDFKGNFIDANQACFDLLGYSKDEIKDINFAKLLDKGQLLKALKVSKMIRKNGFQNETTDFKLKCKNGDFVYVETLSSLLYHDGKPVAIQGIARNLTERKKAEKEIIKQRDKAQKYLDIAGVMFVAINAEGNVTLVNKKGCEVLGYNEGEIVGKNWFDNFVPKRIKEVIVPVSKQLLAGEVENVEYFENPILTKNGEERLIAWNNTILRDEKGNIIGHLSSGEDITERKIAEEKIKKQNIQLKKLDHIKTDFLNTTSHELRTPMASIKGYVQMMQKGILGDISKEQKDVLDVVLRNTNRLDHLIQDLLDISQLESNTMKFVPEKTDVKKMINEISETMKTIAEEKKIKIKTELDEDIPSLIIDKERVGQVMTNLIDNAIKFSPEESLINVRAKTRNDDILLEVQDFGRGIPKNKQKKIFERFYQVDSGMDRKFGGVGLGLAISKSIIEAHGGKIWVEGTGKLGEGSTVKFTLPENSEDHLKKQIKENNIPELIRNT